MATSGAAPAPATRCARTSRRFARWRIVPAHLRDVATRDLSARGARTALPAPVLLAPIGVQTLVHPEGELACARGAAAVGVPYIASTAAPTRWRRSPRRGGAALVPALLAQGRRALRVARPPRRGGRLHGDRRHARHVLPGLAARGPRSGLPAVPAGRGHRAVLQRPGLPRPARAPARGGRAGRRRALGRRCQQGRPVGRPRVAARDHRPADRPQGVLHRDDARQARERRHRRHRRLQPRRPPGRRRHRRARRAPGSPRRSAAS